MSTRSVLFFLICCGLARGAHGQVAITPPEDPIDPVRAGRLSLEELMNLEITSVAGLEQQVLRTPAAIDVITNEDIRRTGHRHVAGALRLSPGMFVGQTGSSRWAISPRGFNAIFANKTLVLMDGRRLYDPLHGGTFWDVQTPLLEDIDRIEVIRGPGPTLWGSNAVNGVINIVNKSTRDTQGIFIEGGAGTTERAFGSFRYGGQLAESAWFSVWGTYFNRGPFEAPGPVDAGDEWELGRGRIRTDIDFDQDVKLMFQVDAYSTFALRQRGRVPVPATFPTFEQVDFENFARGHHILMRLEQMTSPAEGWSILTYYDRTEREASEFRFDRDSFEIDARYHFTAGDRHAFSVGAELFHTSGRAESIPRIVIEPESRQMTTFSAFIQDTITLVPDRWFTMLGSRFEHNSQTGFEVMPSARVWFTPDDRQTIWGAVSRPVRIPSLAETDITYTLFYADPGALEGSPTGTIVPFQFFPNPDLDAERVLVYELGYRNQIAQGFSVDVAGFYNIYSDYISIPEERIGGSFTNEGRAQSYGGEVAVTWQPMENWRLRGSYSFVRVNVEGPVEDTDERETPRHQAQLRSYMDISRNFQLNAAAYFVDEIPARDIDPYVRLDVGATWSINKNFDLSIWGQNLLQRRHQEFSQFEVERGVYAMGTLRF